MHSNHAACTSKPHYHWSFALQHPISSNLSPGRLHAARFQKLNGFWRVTESSQTFEIDIWFSYVYRHRSIWIWDTWLWILLGVWIINTVYDGGGEKTWLALEVLLLVVCQTQTAALICFCRDWLMASPRWCLSYLKARPSRWQTLNAHLWCLWIFLYNWLIDNCIFIMYNNVAFLYLFYLYLFNIIYYIFFLTCWACYSIIMFFTIYYL